MAPSRTPGRARPRQAGDYGAVGKVGRKTGITVPELGPRDDDGLEPIDGLFSSPRKGPTPARSKGAQHTSGSETMALTNGTPDDASSVLRSARRGTLLPPKSRSPMKTALGSSPRRSMGLTSSPLGNRRSQESSQQSLYKAPRRSLNYDEVDERRAEAVRRPAARAQPAKTMMQGRKQTYDLLDEDDEEEEVEQEGVDSDIEEETADVINGMPGREDDELPDMDDIPLPDEPDDQPLEELTPSPSPEPAPIRGSKRKSPEPDPIPSDPEEVAEERPVKRRGRPPGKKNAPGGASKKLAAMAESGGEKTAPKRRGPAKKTLTTDAEAEEVDEDTAATKPKRGRKKGGNKLVHLQEAQPEEEEPVEPFVTRTGRTAVKPLAFWRGEQMVYEPPKRLGKAWIPGGYGGIDHGRKVVERKTPRRTGRKPGRKRAKSREPDISEEEDDEEELDLWETEGKTPGILHTGVMTWDPEIQASSEESWEDVDLAFSDTALRGLSKLDRGNTFKFAKSLTLPFFHSGIVDLAPGGEKRPKNSRKNHLIFWVYSGRVQVDISGTEFSIGRGGMFQVPRGNSYGIVNPYSKDARIMFAQASYMEQPEDEAVLMKAAPAGE